MAYRRARDEATAAGEMTFKMLQSRMMYSRRHLQVRYHGILPGPDGVIAAHNVRPAPRIVADFTAPDHARLLRR